MQQTAEIQAMLEWQLAMGVDETMGDAPMNCFDTLVFAPPAALPAATLPAAAAPAQPTARLVSANTGASTPAKAAQPPFNQSLQHIIEQATQAAQAANTLAELQAAVEAFEGCGLKKSARKTVFGEGAATASVMLIGDTPDTEEDMQGLPFCGQNGQLLNKMLASIGLSRTENCYLSNAIYWRPPGGRAPTPEELSICRPFVQRQVALVAPKLIIVAGSMAAKMLLQEERGMMRLRGQALQYEKTPVRALFHPSFLMNQPLQKKLAWQDLLAISALLDDTSAT